jgi:hypothetical protein
MAAPLPVTAVQQQQQQQQSGRTASRHQQQGDRRDGSAADAADEMEVDQGDSGTSSVAAAAAAEEAERAKQVLFVQEMAEAGLRGLCLDDAGAVVEFGWARQRSVPAKWMRSLACMPLPGQAARGSMSVTRGSSCCVGGWQSGLAGLANPQQQQQQRLSEVLPRQRAEPDGMPGHWLGYPYSNAAASVVVAAASGSVVQLQRLSGVEGELLATLQQLLLRHPLTRALVLARGQVVGCEQQQGQLQQQQRSLESWMKPGGPKAASVGLGRAPMGAVDGSLLRMFLCLPYQLQLLLLDSVLGQLQGYSQEVSVGERQMLQDGIRCRLQLVPCPDLL